MGNSAHGMFIVTLRSSPLGKLNLLYLLLGKSRRIVRFRNEWGKLVVKLHGMVGGCEFDKFSHVYCFSERKKEKLCFLETSGLVSWTSRWVPTVKKLNHIFTTTPLDHVILTVEICVIVCISSVGLSPLLVGSCRVSLFFPYLVR